MPASPSKDSSTDGWAGASRRARGVAAALAVVFAVLTLLVVNRTWRQAAPPRPALSGSVEARLVASPSPPASALRPARP